MSDTLKQLDQNFIESGEEASYQQKFEFLKTKFNTATDIAIKKEIFFDILQLNKEYARKNSAISTVLENQILTYKNKVDQIHFINDLKTLQDEYNKEIDKLQKDTQQELTTLEDRVQKVINYTQHPVKYLDMSNSDIKSEVLDINSVPVKLRALLSASLSATLQDNNRNLTPEQEKGIKKAVLYVNWESLLASDQKVFNAFRTMTLSQDLDKAKQELTAIGYIFKGKFGKQELAGLLFLKANWGTLSPKILDTYNNLKTQEQNISKSDRYMWRESLQAQQMLEIAKPENQNTDTQQGLQTFIGVIADRNIDGAVGSDGNKIGIIKKWGDLVKDTEATKKNAVREGTIYETMKEIFNNGTIQANLGKLEALIQQGQKNMGKKQLPKGFLIDDFADTKRQGSDITKLFDIFIDNPEYVIYISQGISYENPDDQPDPKPNSNPDNNTPVVIDDQKPNSNPYKPQLNSHPDNNNTPVVIDDQKPNSNPYKPQLNSHPDNNNTPVVIDDSKPNSNPYKPSVEVVASSTVVNVPYPAFDYIGKDARDNMEIRDVYNDRKRNLAKVMESWFDDEYSDDLNDEHSKELKKRTFHVNLSAENGLARYVLAIRDTFRDKGYEGALKLYGDGFEKVLKVKNGYLVGFNEKFGIHELKMIEKLHGFTYDSQGGLFERSRIAKIFRRAKWDDLATFGEIMKQSGKQGVVEYHNTLELIGESNRDEVRGKPQLSVLSEDEKVPYDQSRLYQLLADTNADGSLSSESKNPKAKNVGQQYRGDMGPIFGQQLYHALIQSIKLAEVNNPGQGEQTVIKNIVSNITIVDSRDKSNPKLQQAVKELQANPTRKNLIAFINEYPSGKVLFRTAIDKINGSNSVLSPDLVDNLAGGKRYEIVDTKNPTDIQIAITQVDEYLKNLTPEQQAKLEAAGGAKKVRDNAITAIFRILDGTTVRTTDNSQGGPLSDGGVEWKKSLGKEAAGRFINCMLTGKLTKPNFSFQSGKEYVWNNGKQKFSWQAGPTRDGDGLGFIVGGEYQHQYNYEKVIGSSLDNIKSAKYIAVEGKGYIGIGGVQFSVGPNRQQDFVMAINQIDNHYQNVASQLFTLTEKPTTPQALKTALEAQLQTLESDKNFGRFVKNNRNRLSNDIDMIVKFVESDKILDNVKDLTDLNTILSVLADGQINHWRHSVHAGLQGDLNLTKIGAGVIFGGAWNQIEKMFGGKPFSLQQFFYLNGRVSSYVNSYHPDKKLLASKNIKIEQGKFDDFEPKGTNDAEKATHLASYIDARLHGVGVKTRYEGGKIVIEGADANHILKRLNIYAHPQAKGNFAVEGNKVTIGNVGGISAVSMSTQNGIQGSLILGGNKLDGAIKLTGDVSPEANFASQTLSFEAKPGGLPGGVEPLKNYTEDEIENKLLSKLPPEAQEFFKALIVTTNDGTFLADSKDLTFKGKPILYYRSNTPPFGQKLPIPSIFVLSYDSATDRPILSFKVPDPNERGLYGITFTYQEKGKNGTETVTDSTDNVSFERDPQDPLNDVKTLMEGLKDKEKHKSDYDKLVNLTEKRRNKTTNNRDADQETLRTTFKQFLEAKQSGNYDQAESYLKAIFDHKNVGIASADTGFGAVRKLLDTQDKDKKRYAINSMVSLLAVSRYTQNKVDATPEAQKTVLDQKLDTAFSAYGQGADQLKQTLKQLSTTYDVATWEQVSGKIKTYLATMQKNPAYGYGEKLNIYLAARDIYNMMRSNKDMIDDRKNNFENISKNLPDAVKNMFSTYREDIKNTDFGKSNKRKRVQDDTMFGMTAFYRTAAKGFDMTQPGDTNIVEGSLKKITDTEQASAVAKWFADNMKNYEPEVKFILKNMIKGLSKTQIDTNALDVNVLISLLKDGTATIKNADGKDVTISATIEWNAYLLGECGNESVGPKFTQVKIEQKGLSTQDQEYSVTGMVASGPGGVGKISGESFSVSSNITTTEKKVSYQHAMNINKNQQNKTNNETDVKADAKSGDKVPDKPAESQEVEGL